MTTRLAVVSLIALTAATSSVQAESLTRNLPPNLNVDAAGQTLRRAFNGYEGAESTGLPQSWSIVALAPGKLVEIGDDQKLLLVSTTSSSADLMHLHGSSSASHTLTPGPSTDLGEISIILAEVTRGQARVLVRATNLAPTFSDAKPSGGSRIRIEGPTEKSVRIDSPVKKDLQFADRFMAEWFRGAKPEDALSTAWAAHPPTRPAVAMAAETQPFSYTDPTNIRMGLDDGPGDVTVTLTSALVDSAAMSSLTSSLSYRSDGRTGSSPVAVQGGGSGVDASYGRPGDRFSATLSALEREGKIKSRSEATVRVPLQSWSSFSYQSANGYANGGVFATYQGKRIGLEFDFDTGDGVNRSGRSSKIYLQNGQTALVSRYQSSRTESYSSGPPLVGGIPYIGPLIGNSGKSSSNFDWALFATVQQD